MSMRDLMDHEDEYDNTHQDDDNAQDDQPLVETNEDPLIMAMEDLEGRVVSAMDDVKVHPGVRTGDVSIHEELAVLLRPVLEVAAHTSTSVARTYSGPDGLENSVELLYERIVSDLVLPILLEMAQSDPSPAKRGACLEFMKNLWKEVHKAGSWLDTTTTGPQAGPYGAGGSGPVTPALRQLQKRRINKALAKQNEILRYWVEAAAACLVSGVFTNADSESAVVSRGVLAASASLRPSLRHVSNLIKDADDRGATRLYTPVMKMVQGVIRKLFVESSATTEAVRSSCIKFLEIVVMCCSRKPQERRRGGKDPANRRRGLAAADEFSLDDLPMGHAIITQEALETISQYAFTSLRGLTMMGGQVKIDLNVLSDLMQGTTSPSEQIVAILKPAALAYLELEAALQANETSLEFDLERSNVEFDFYLSQKSYALTINAMSALAIHRPVFFKDSAVCLARRAVAPPVESGTLNKTAILVITSQLKASCMTLLRNASSVTTGSCTVLHKALVQLDMEVQADKAQKMANQAHKLATGTRAEKNEAKMYYEWDASGSTKRQKETDDALAMMRATKKARGLGRGIQLPSNMADMIELVSVNLANLPSKRPAPTKSKHKETVTLDFVVDAIMTNGASLLKEEGNWYDRDGGNSWMINEQGQYQLSGKLAETMQSVKENVSDKEKDSKKQVFMDQCYKAASDAVGRILDSAANSRSKAQADLGKQLAARLSFTLQKVKPSQTQNSSYELAKESLPMIRQVSDDDEEKKGLDELVDEYPLVAASLAFDADSSMTTVNGNGQDAPFLLSDAVLNEALLQSRNDLFDRSLEIFVASAVRSSERANEKPGDMDRKRAAVSAASIVQFSFAKLARLTPKSLRLLSGMCNIDEITKKTAEASKKSTQDSISVAAALHAAKVAAEKRATSVLLVLRDVAFQRDEQSLRKSAVECVVNLATGRLPSSHMVCENALKLAMNVLFPKTTELADMVVVAARGDLENAATEAINKYAEIEKANEEAAKRTKDPPMHPLSPRSDIEKQTMESMRKPAILFMVICVSRPELIRLLFSICSREKADVLSRTVRANMYKLATAAATNHGAAAIALQVAGDTGTDETAMLLSFLENLPAKADKSGPDPEIIEACYKIYEIKLAKNGKKDPRYLIPVVSVMKRKDLKERLHEFVAADDKVFLAALVRMGDRVGRLALLFRDEPDEENPSLSGLTLCEQLVELHKLDFERHGLLQKRYLAAINLCLENDDVYNDRVVQSALDVMSGQFLTSADSLPRAFMRTTIIVFREHESLHSWICDTLLPRLVEGKIWDDPRQWEGWMRCAKYLEDSQDPSLNVAPTIENLPKTQLMQYRSKWASK